MSMEQCNLCPAAARMAAKKRYGQLLPIAEEVIGVKMGKTRSYRNVMVRRFIACRMRDENIPVCDIAEAMGMHHASICHYLKQMRYCVDEPIFYAKELELYFKFVEYVRDEDDSAS